MVIVVPLSRSDADHYPNARHVHCILHRVTGGDGLAGIPAK